MKEEGSTSRRRLARLGFTARERVVLFLSLPLVRESWYAAVGAGVGAWARYTWDSPTVRTVDFVAVAVFYAELALTVAEWRFSGVAWCDAALAFAAPLLLGYAASEVSAAPRCLLLGALACRYLAAAAYVLLCNHTSLFDAVLPAGQQDPAIISLLGQGSDAAGGGGGGGGGSVHHHHHTQCAPDPQPFASPFGDFERSATFRSLVFPMSSAARAAAAHPSSAKPAAVAAGGAASPVGAGSPVSYGTMSPPAGPTPTNGVAAAGAGP
eukprot:Rhum_TRINITY_DN13673_c2_g1::Rhum_TRINITY_DN13673_c2_g1_i1::g.62735::m.62735